MTQEEQEQLESYLNYARTRLQYEPTETGKEMWRKLIDQAIEESETHD